MDCNFVNVLVCSTEFIPVVNSMSILCLWSIQLTSDMDGIEPVTF